MHRWFMLACTALVLAACIPSAPQQATPLLAMAAAMSSLQYLDPGGTPLAAEPKGMEPNASDITPPDVPSDWINGESLGNPDAPVVVQVWSDFLCPACQSFAQTVQPQLIDEYVTSGRVRLEYLYFPLEQHEPAATRSALAGACAAEQNRFWEYEQLLTNTLRKEGLNALKDTHFDERLVVYAASLGLDADAFSLCLAEERYADRIAQSVADATAARVLFVPNVFVGDVMLLESSFAAIQAEIERQLQ